MPKDKWGYKWDIVEWGLVSCAAAFMLMLGAVFLIGTR